MPSFHRRIKLTIMDFYDDIDVDFGDKLDLFGVGELIEIREGSPSKKKSAGRKKNKRGNKIILCEDDVEDTEYTVYNPPKEEDRDCRTIAGGIDMAEKITQEVSEVTGNALLNEPLEQKYRDQNVVVMKSKSKLRSSPKSKKVTPDSKITNKANLLKEMNAMVVGADVQTNTGAASDSKVAFSSVGNKKEKNALLRSLEKQKNTEVNCNACRSSTASRENQTGDESKSKANSTAKAVNEQNEKSQLQHQESIRYPADTIERVRLWLQSSPTNSCSDGYSEEEFYYSNNDSNTTTDGSSSYFTASASDNDTPQRKYRATSKRFAAKKSAVVSEAKIGFKTNTTAVTTKHSSNNAPASKSSTVNTTKKKTSTRKFELYTPGSYNTDFKLKESDFPAIC